MSVKQVIVIRKDLNMRKGKMAAQAAHASIKVLLDQEVESGVTFPADEDGQSEDWIKLEITDDMAKWLLKGFKKVVVSCANESELALLYTQAKMAKIPCAMIIDSGRTEFHGQPTQTCIAIGPAKDEEIDKITGNLKLL